MTLTKAGVPWDIVMSLDHEERQGMCVAAGLADGHQFDWKAGQWVKPK